MAPLVEGARDHWGCLPSAPRRSDGSPGHHLLPPAAGQHLCKGGGMHGHHDVVAARSLPLGSVSVAAAAAGARQPRARRCSLEEAPPQHQQHQQAGQQHASIKQRLRQRRFSIAIGEKIPLGTIQENLQDDTAPAPDQFSPVQHSHGVAGVRGVQQQQHPAAAGTGRLMAAAGDPANSTRAYQPGTACYPELSAAAHRDCSAGAAWGYNTPLHQQHQQHQQSLSAPLMQLTARHTAHLWQQYQDLPQQQHLLPLELPDAHNAPGWSQEQFLQQRRRMQQQGEQQQQRRQARGQRQAEQQEQEGQQQQQELLAWHDDSWQVQQLLELSGVWPGSSRHHAVAEHQLNQQQRAAEQRQALSALQVIEHELQQLFTMHDWLAQTHATAAPGSRAAVACASALLQHQQVLQQALEAREALEAAALEATAALVASGGPPSIAAGSSAGGICMQPRGLEAAGMGGAALELDSSHINCLEEGEPLYPVDGAEVLLQHFGHFAII